MYSKSTLVALAVISAFALASVQAMGQLPKTSEPGLPATFVGSTLTCSQPLQTPSIIRVPAPLVARAKLKARLASLLRDSLYDDAKGIVNTAREKEIRKLANKLRNSRD